MKLLFDQNLSHRLVSLLASEFPDSMHVRSVDMARAPDAAVWNFARHNGLVITSKDSDFQQRALLLGHPPKVVWVRLGNCSTDDVAHLLQIRQAEIWHSVTTQRRHSSLCPKSTSCGLSRRFVATVLTTSSIVYCFQPPGDATILSRSAIIAILRREVPNALACSGSILPVVRLLLEYSERRRGCAFAIVALDVGL
jgi:predicted nuclease of predicted toxin-antitoxin system